MLDDFKIWAKNIMLFELKGRLTEKIGPENKLKPYNPIVVPQMEYASPVWQIAHCGQLEKIQTKGLAVSLGCPNTSSCEALEVQAGLTLRSKTRRDFH